MSNKIGIICDSTSYFTNEFSKKHDIYIVDLSVIVDGKSYLDLKEINNEQLFEYMDAGKKVTTSQPTPESFLEAMNIMSEKYSKIICFTVSSGLSGTYNSAVLAKDMYEGSATIEVIDTLTSGMGIKACVDKLHSLANLSFDVVTTKLKNYVKSSTTFLTIDDLQTLVNHGRMKASQAMIGNLLKIKPLLTLDDEGKVQVFKRIRTHKKLLLEIAELSLDKSVEKIYVTYVGKKEYATQLINQIKDKMDSVEIELCKEVGPVLSVPLGKGGIGIYLLKKYNMEVV